MAKLIIGIDFSKEKMNYCCMDGQGMVLLMEGETENSRRGCGEMTARLRGLGRGLRSCDFLFCGENTGIYSIEAAECLTSRGYTVWLENPLQIKLSSGLHRSKTDTVDARMIAEYAFRHIDRAVAYSPSSDGQKKLRELHLTRRKLKECEVSLRNLSASLPKVSPSAMEALEDVLETLGQSVRRLEKEIRELLTADPEFQRNATLAVSVPGISWVTASAIILDTRNFTRFPSARQYANHTGCVPHEHSSGSSIHRRPRVSRVSNRYINSLLTQGANSLLAHNSQTRAYAERKRGEGKPHGCIVNNIRNKTIHRLFAVVRSGVPFDWSISGSRVRQPSCDGL